MIHEMRLHPLPFEQIKYGSKTLESRLNDAKRQKLHKGDKIKFLKRPDFSEFVTAEIIDLHTYKTFEDLFKSFSAEKFGGINRRDSLDSIYGYYSKEDEAKFGVVGIEFQIKN